MCSAAHRDDEDDHDRHGEGQNPWGLVFLGVDSEGPLRVGLRLLLETGEMMGLFAL